MERSTVDEVMRLTDYEVESEIVTFLSEGGKIMKCRSRLLNMSSRSGHKRRKKIEFIQTDGEATAELPVLG